MLRLCCLMILVVGATAAASSSSSSSTKREDPNTGGSGGGSQPVYSPSVAASSYSSSAYDAGDASSGYKAQPNSQGNLYYYYYPVQEKAQDNAYASSSTHNYATAPASSNNYESSDSGSNTYHSAQASDSYSSQDANYAGALNQLSGYGLANGYSLGSTGISSAGLSSAGLSSALGAAGLGTGAAGLGSYGIGGLSPGYAAAGIPAAYAAGGSLGSYPAGSAGVANYAPQSTLAQYAAQLGGYGSQYGASSGYGVPQGYGTPSRRYGLGSLLVPMIALAGLTMLIPSVTSTLGSRTKRSTTEEIQKNPLTLITEYKDKLERYYSLYRTAVEKEECMNRIICEVGSAVSDVKGKGAVVLIMEKLLPKSMRSKMNVFKAGALSGETGKCKKLFKC